jgi:hypothetical protein
MQVDRSMASRGALSVARTIVASQGALSLWQGNGVNVLRIVPNAAIKFSCNDVYKQMLTPAGGDPRHLSVAQKLMAGSASGVTMTLATYPLDLARTRVTADMVAGSSARHFNGLWDCLRKTVSSEGAGGLYKGLVPSVSSIIPYVGIGFTLYDEVKIRLAGGAQQDELSFGARLAAGSFSGVAAQSMTYPIDTVRRRMQMDGALGTPKMYGGCADCTRQLWQQGGIGIFYRGLAVNAMKTTPGAAIQFCAYDVIKVRRPLRPFRRPF